MHVVSVVPIFMSAGAAVLPTLMAAVTSVAAILFKPRELLRILRERPGRAAITLGTIGALSVGIWWLLRDSPAQAKTNKPQAGVQVDWARVAQNIIDYRTAQEAIRKQAAEHQVKVFVAWAHHGWPTSDEPAEFHQPLPIVVGRDYFRASYGGGPSPRELLPLWRFQPPDETMFLSVPVVSGDRIFVAGCTTDQKLIGLLACLDAETGKPRWQINDIEGIILEPFFSSPALTADGKNLIIGGGLHIDHDCSLRCFNAETGQQRWAVKTPLHIESSPAILGDMVVVGCGAIEGEDGKAIGDPGHVLAVRISDGKELWRQPVNDPESTPAIADDGTVYIGSGFNGNALVALRSEPDDELRRKGLQRIIWRTPVSQPVTSTITLVGDLVITGAGNSDFVNANPHPDGFVAALDRKTGIIRWQQKFGDAVLSQIAHRDGKLYCPVRTGEVAALDLTNGNILWRAPISGRTPVMAGCAVTGKFIYAVSSDGFLAVLDPTNGKTLEKIYLNDPSKPGTGKSLCAPQVVNGRVIVGSETGGVRCFIGRSAQ